MVAISVTAFRKNPPGSCLGAAPYLLSMVLLASVAVDAAETGGYRLKSWRAANPVWRGVHLMARSDRQIDELTNALPRLVQDGVNVLVLEADYNFEFQSHPEVRGGAFITRAR